ncbi:hypothetical protein Aperf_G00000068575 [Anoplocephala perfoliata]
MVAGFLCIGVGGYMFHRLAGSSGVSRVHSIPLFLLIVGVLIVLVAVPGFIGAVCKNVCLLKTFAALLMVMIILEIVAAILVIVYKNQVSSFVTKFMKDSIEKYRGDRSKTLLAALNTIQRGFKCCGGDGPADWMGEEGDHCCKTDTPCPGSSFTEGCGEAVYDGLKNHVVGAGVALFIFCIIEVFALASSLFLAKKIRAAY